jgi:hypothetical protein
MNTERCGARTRPPETSGTPGTPSTVGAAQA